MVLGNWSDLTETCKPGAGRTDESRFLGNPEPLPSVFSVDSVALAARTWEGSMALWPQEKPHQLKGSPSFHCQLGRLEVMQSGWCGMSAVKSLDQDAVWVRAVCRSYKRALGPLKPELQMAVNKHVGAGNQIQILW